MKWLALRLCGQKWSVHLVSPKSKYLDYGVYEGRCLFDKSRVYLAWDRAEDPSLVHARLLHELRHVLNRENGAWDVLANALGEKEAGRVDEIMVTVETPHWLQVLKDLGFVFPKLPSQ